MKISTQTIFNVHVDLSSARLALMCVCVLVRWLKFLRFDSSIHPSVSISDLFIYFIFNTHSLFSHYNFFPLHSFCLSLVRMRFGFLCAVLPVFAYRIFLLEWIHYSGILDGIIILFAIKQRRYPITRFQSFFSRSHFFCALFSICSFFTRSLFHFSYAIIFQLTPSICEMIDLSVRERVWVWRTVCVLSVRLKRINGR